MDWIQWMVQATPFGAISSVNITTMLGPVTKIHRVCYLPSIQHNEVATELLVHVQVTFFHCG